MKKDISHINILKLLSLIVIFWLLNQKNFAQYNLDYYLTEAVANSATLNEIRNSELLNKLQDDFNYAQNSAFQTFITANYLFAPYFNNNGHFITTDPRPDAIGYDIGVTNGGLYSALINVEKNIFNGGITGALANQVKIQKEKFSYNYNLEKRNLEKQITDQYLNTFKSLKIYRLSEDALYNTKKQLDITRELVATGYEKVQNFLLLKVELQSQEIAFDESYRQYKNDLTQLNALSGMADTRVVYIDSVEIFFNKENHFDFVKKFKIDSLVAVSEMQLLEAKYKPEVKVYFNTGLNAIEVEGIQRKFGLSAGLDFKLAIFDGGQRDISNQQNEILLNSISVNEQFELKKIENNRNIALSNIQFIENNLKNFQEQIYDYTKLINISQKELESGNISMIEYLTIWKNYIEIQKAKVDKEVSLMLEINNYNYWN
jgi:outer membrane protein TolC